MATFMKSIAVVIFVLTLLVAVGLGATYKVPVEGTYRTESRFNYWLADIIALVGSVPFGMLFSMGSMIDLLEEISDNTQHHAEALSKEDQGLDAEAEKTLTPTNIGRRSRKYEREQ